MLIYHVDAFLQHMIQHVQHCTCCTVLYSIHTVAVGDNFEDATRPGRFIFSVNVLVQGRKSKT